jgi:hypothetical protein
MGELHCCALSLLEAVGFRCIAASAGRQRDALRGFHNVGYSAHFEQRLLKTLIPRPPRGYCQPVCCSHGQFREAIVFYLASDRCNITTRLRSNKITCEWKTNPLTILTKCLSSCGLFLGNYFSQVCTRRCHFVLLSLISWLSPWSQKHHVTPLSCMPILELRSQKCNMKRMAK